MRRHGDAVILGRSMHHCPYDKSINERRFPWQWASSLQLWRFLSSCRSFEMSWRSYGITVMEIVHDDVIKWKHFPCHWPLCGKFTGDRWISRTNGQLRFDVFFDLRLNKRLNKQPWGWWFETPAWSLWRHRNVFKVFRFQGCNRQQGNSFDFQ